MRKAASCVVTAALAALLAIGAAGCGQADLTKVKVDNPALTEAWNKYAEAEEAGVNGMLLQRVRQDLATEEEHLKKYYLETGDTRSEGIEAIIAGLAAELQKYIDDLSSGTDRMTPVEQERVFESIREVLLPNLGPGEYVYAVAVSTTDPTWALAWFDKNLRDFTVEGPAFALRLAQDTWMIKYAGHDVSAFPGLPAGLADNRDVYVWLSDTAWVVTQTESYAEAARPGQPYRLERFDFDATSAYAYVYLKFETDTMGFRYQKTLRAGWALIETYLYPPEAAGAKAG